MYQPVSRENFPGATGIVGNVEVFDTKVTNGDCIHQMARYQSYEWRLHLPNQSKHGYHMKIFSLK